MDEIIDREVSSKFLDDAYKCKPNNLGFLLQKIEYEIQNRDHADSILLRAKTVVTSKIALMNSK
ncbi:MULTISPECIES: hypothetical protein [Methanobacterium]|uniref:Uncharacterized protein n=1 Tax=Methanobacterium bryantii TaxID=2161 RepID=A0A2A2HAP5_METBR|nr:MULTISPECIES: hypothetical protein [Methanobacterium]OEC88475.1 hypothetical protein A9507_04275 [Methanobacterium sp. A39]PAV06370.1 hypothetical protein ASJ80_16250 [Methanobacterium bryantii]